MGMTNVSHIATGITGWQEDGLETQSYDDWNTASE